MIPMTITPPVVLSRGAFLAESAFRPLACSVTSSCATVLKSLGPSIPLHGWDLQPSSRFGSAFTRSMGNIFKTPVGAPAPVVLAVLASCPMAVAFGPSPMPQFCRPGTHLLRHVVLWLRRLQAVCAWMTHCDLLAVAAVRMRSFRTLPRRPTACFLQLR